MTSHGTSRSLRLTAAKSSISGAPRAAAAALAAVTPGMTSMGTASCFGLGQLDRQPRHAVNARVAGGNQRHGFAAGRAVQGGPARSISCGHAGEMISLPAVKSAIRSR